MFTYYLVTGIITLALIALCAYSMADKTKAKQLINKLQKELQELEDKLGKAENKALNFKDRYETNVKLFEELQNVSAEDKKAIKTLTNELELKTNNYKEVERTLNERLELKENRIKTLENKVAELKKELNAKEEVKVAEEVKEEIVPEVVKEDVKVEETKTEEAQPKKMKKPYKRIQKKQN